MSCERNAVRPQAVVYQFYCYWMCYRYILDANPLKRYLLILNIPPKNISTDFSEENPLFWLLQILCFSFDIAYIRNDLVRAACAPKAVQFLDKNRRESRSRLHQGTILSPYHLLALRCQVVRSYG